MLFGKFYKIINIKLHSIHYSKDDICHFLSLRLSKLIGVYNKCCQLYTMGISIIIQ